jgi:hypothetical protein
MPMAVQTPIARCPRCGLRRHDSSSFCPACGFIYPHTGASGHQQQSAEQTMVPISPFPKPSMGATDSPERQRRLSGPSSMDTTRITNQGAFSLQRLLRWRKLTGTVIAVEPPYMAKPEMDLAKLLGKLALGILLLPVILVVGATALVISVAFSVLSFGRGGGPGLFSNIASQVFSFFLIGKLFGPRREVPVRDIRLRDASGLENLVRIQGEMRAGNLNVGDEVEVEGFDRGGTLMFRRGWNKRIRSEIVVKHP